MELPNTYFKDFPIEFKNLEVHDFSTLFNVEKKELDLKGIKYLSEVLDKNIDIHIKNTVVINTPVGNGKSYAIIKTIQKYYLHEDNFLIFVASPFVSLVEQYCEGIEKFAEIPKSDIYNYNSIGRSNETYLHKKVHVITANTLLGNPGEDGYKNSEAKIHYLTTLQEHCLKNNIKVVFIYDEIHDTIHNFKEELIFNLWNWRKVIYKNYIISATFNEASKVVIEYLAELTDKKIQILETKRKVNNDNCSDLYLHYSSMHHFTNETPEIKNTILDIVKRGKNIDILTYSRKLAKSLIQDKEISKLLTDKFEKINDCTSENTINQRKENKTPENRFNDTKCNIGTNFKSGVSILKENHAFVIVLPPRSSQSIFKNKYGIFSSGISSIVQAIARKRKVGEIHIVLPRPDELNYDTLKFKFNDEQLTMFKKHYKKVQNYNTDLVDEDKPRHLELRFQSLYLDEFYNEKLRANLENSIEYTKNLDRGDLASLNFPTFKNFILTRGESFLAQKFKFWGADLSSYVTYCAFTNQFVNCTLKGINSRETISFIENDIQNSFKNFYLKYIGDDLLDSLLEHSNYYKFYENIRKYLFNEFTLKYQNANQTNFVTIHPYNNAKFERQLLHFTSILYYHHNSTSSPYESTPINEYTRAQYFLDGIACSENLDSNDFNNNPDVKERIIAFQNLNHFRKQLERVKNTYSKQQTIIQYLTIKPKAEFLLEQDIPKFNQVIDYFKNKDEFIKNGVFEFIRNATKLPHESKVNSFYTILVEDFYNLNTKRKITVNSNEPRIEVKPIISLKNIPALDKALNLIIEPQTIITDNELQDLINTGIKEYGSEEKYYEEERKLLDLLQ